jgi:hypothetical protein
VVVCGQKKKVKTAIFPVHKVLLLREKRDSSDDYLSGKHGVIIFWESMCAEDLQMTT